MQRFVPAFDNRERAVEYLDQHILFTPPPLHFTPVELAAQFELFVALEMIGETPLGIMAGGRC